MKILVVAQEYPSEGDIYRNQYIHTRLKTYVEEKHEVVVISFFAKADYEIDNVKVVTEKSFELNFKITEFELVIVHAPNLRNQLRFLITNNNINKLAFVIHGHEVLKRSAYYPEPYTYMKSRINFITKRFDDLYDILKLWILKKYFNKKISENKCNFVFVSQWMMDEFLMNINIPEEKISNVSCIVPNPIGDDFLRNDYDFNSDKIADFITIRPYNRSKHCIDVVTKIAEQNPNKKFHIYGNGNYFDYNFKPQNIEVFPDYIHHSELPKLLNKYKAALMPTRLDSQGVMMCEMAAYGIPVVTSNIKITKEMLEGFKNTYFVDNELVKFNATKFLNSLKISKSNKTKFSRTNTINKEIDFMKFIISNKDC